MKIKLVLSLFECWMWFWCIHHPTCGE